MTDSPRPGSTPQSGGTPSPEPTHSYQGYSDPAYAGSAPYGPSYTSASMPSQPAPTEPLPQYWTQTYPQSGSQTPHSQTPPEPMRGPRPWVWAVVGFAVAAVIALLLFLVYVNTNPSQQETSIPAMPQSTTARTPPRTTTPSMPSILPIPLPTLTLPTPTTSKPNTTGETEPVTYEVTGQGRAINITYIDNGGVMQTEFNVLLPWSKDVNLPKPAKDSASITVINAGRDVTCRISIGGVQVQERTGALLTVCSPSG